MSTSQNAIIDMQLNLIHEMPEYHETPIHKEFREMMDEIGIKFYSPNTF